MEAAADVQQHALDAGIRRQLEQQFGQLLFALGLHRGGEQPLLVGEVTVHGQLGHAGLGGDGVHAAAVVAVSQEEILGGFENRLSLRRVFWAAWAAGRK
ncbi:hypothetical protein D3C72_1354050 [compost metagenome]